MLTLCQATRAAFAARQDVSAMRSSVIIASRAPLARTARAQRPVLRAAVIKAAADATSTVKILIQGRGGLTVTEPIREYVQAKVSKAIHNYEGAVKEVDVRLSVRGKSRSTEAHHQRHQIVEVTVFTLRHGVVRVEDEEEDAYAAVDLVTDKLKRKLSKLKEKAVQKSNWPGRGGSKGADSLQDVLPEEVDDSLPLDGVAPGLAPEIVREKVVVLEPTSAEAAVEQLENVGHDFFLFVDAKDGQTKVLYRRRSHGYGVLIAQSPV